MKPNIVLFVCDDLRWDVLSGMNHPVVRTPNIDKLMQSGTTFTRCYIPGGSDKAVCMPSRAMLHTGRFLFNIDRAGEEIPADHTLIGEWLNGQGYDRFHTGKWHNERSCFNRSFNGGDEIFFGGMGDQWNMPLHHYDPEGNYSAQLPFIRDPFEGKEVECNPGDHTSAGQHATDLFAETACKFVRERSTADNPFFLSVALTAPHDPRSAPQEFHELYPASDIKLPRNFLAQHPHDTGGLRVRDEILGTIPRIPGEIRQHIADYYAMITHLDRAFGRLYSSLEASGQLENTLIIFTADHGLAVGQHGLMGKQCLYDHSVRVPFIMSGPGIDENLKVNELVCHFDLFATLAELLGTPPPDNIQSQSMVPIMKGSTGRDELYLAYESSIRGLLKGPFKLIEYATPVYRNTQLFNLDEDPEECCDLFHLPAYAEWLEKMRQRLLELSVSCGDRTHFTGKVFWSYFT